MVILHVARGGGFRRSAQALVALCITAFLAAEAPTSAPTTRPKFTLGKDTTRIVGPLLPDGRPDYIAALNESRAREVTLENNFVAEMTAISGLGLRAEPQREYIARLGLKETPPPLQSLELRDWLQRGGIALNREMFAQVKQPSLEPWTPEECPVIAQWMEACSPTLTRFAKATTRPIFYSPTVTREQRQGLAGAVSPHLNELRIVSEAMATRAMLRLGQGQIEQAGQDILAIHRMARLASHDPMLIGKLVAYGLEGDATARELVFARCATPEAAKAFLAGLSDLPPRGAATDAVDVAERYMLLDAVLRAATYGPEVLEPMVPIGIDGKPTEQVAGLGARNGDWDAELRTVNETLDAGLVTMRLPGPQARRVASTQLGAKTRELKGVSGFLLRQCAPAYSAMATRAGMAAQRSNIAMLAIALAAYRGETGKYPDALGELAPKYVASVPKDIFGGADLGYRREGEGYTLWSTSPEKTPVPGFGVTMKK